MNILITGSSRGIGYELAKVFVKSDKKVNLYLISRSGMHLNRLRDECIEINNNASITVIPFDLESILYESLTDEINCDHIDILINNAGALYKKKFTDYTTEDILHISKVNFIAPSILIKQCISKLGGNHTSHVVNIASMGGFQGSVKFPELSYYSATKAALASLTECLAAEFSGSNIFFNCLALGAVKTEMFEEAFPGYSAPLDAVEMAKYIAHFALEGHRYYNGKVLPVSITTP